MDAERNKWEVAKIQHVEEEFRIFRLYFNVCSAWMIYKIGIISKRWLVSIVMFWILRWHTLERLFCSTSAGLERLFSLTSAGLVRMKHVRAFGGRFQRAKVFGGWLQRPSPFLIRCAPRCERGWMLSETREKLQKYCILMKQSCDFGCISTPPACG